MRGSPPLQRRCARTPLSAAERGLHRQRLEARHRRARFLNREDERFGASPAGGADAGSGARPPAAVRCAPRRCGVPAEWNGLRTLLFTPGAPTSGPVLQQSRRGNLIQDRFPDLVRAAADLPPGLVACPSRPCSAERRQAAGTPPVWPPKLPLERLYTEHQPANPWSLCPETTDEALAHGWLGSWTEVLRIEGLVVRGSRQHYLPGTGALIKVRRRETTEAIIGAITGPPSHPRGLVLGRLDQYGNLRPVGCSTSLRAGRRRSAADGTADGGRTRPPLERRPVQPPGGRGRRSMSSWWSPTWLPRPPLTPPGSGEPGGIRGASPGFDWTSVPQTYPPSARAPIRPDEQRLLLQHAQFGVGPAVRAASGALGQRAARLVPIHAS